MAALKVRVPVYKDEVLGRRVMVEFLIDDTDVRVSFPGQIRKLKMHLLDDGTVETEHFILFDDNDTKWFDIVVEEEFGRLQWIDDDRKPSANNKTRIKQDSDSVKREESTGPHSVKSEESPTAGSAKSKEATPHPVKCEELTPKRAAETVAITPGKNKKQRTIYQEDSPAPPVKNEDPLVEDDAETSNDDEESGDNLFDDISALPKSIDAIIRYMDHLEPDQGYFERQADSRDGCSKTRSKLRIFANKNPNHPAVSHWKTSGSWTPPNKATLDSMIQLLKEMIR
jgi:hypothetical protein